MARVDEYRRYAAECIRVAQQSPDPSDKTILLDIAQKWRELAHKLEAEERRGQPLEKQQIHQLGVRVAVSDGHTYG